MLCASTGFIAFCNCVEPAIKSRLQLLKPYSLDLRERLYEQGQNSIAEIVAAFSISTSFVKKMLASGA